MKKVNPLIQWWMTPKLPREHIFIPTDKRPKGLYQKVRVYFRKWIVHPIKRRIAKYYLLILKEIFGLTVIGITGSAGKTSTKDMIASILSLKGKTVSSYKNIDPVYNIPTTILRCRPNTRYLVLEMGVEYPGEMDYYLWLAQPTVGVITNIYPTHTLFFKNTKGVAKEKTKLVKAVKEGGFVVMNKNIKYLREVSKEVRAKVVWFGAGADVSAKNLVINQNLRTEFILTADSDKVDVEIPLLGNQFVQNAQAAAAVGVICGISLKIIKKGLENFTPPEHRMKPIKLRSGALVLDDSYNNNPQAAKEALLTLKMVSENKKRVVVMGDMLELGSLEKRYHKEIGRLIGKGGIDYLVGVGQASKDLVEEAAKFMKKGSYWWVSNWQMVEGILRPLLKKQTVVLIKGSRSIGLDNVVLQLSK